ncbi:unnamed protein product [Anisakis simplex]|uniref:AAI domain-containing protein n=1 Tax=Anisakis simplex TaxID=6269 RepID=A0A0M3K3P0_ANISI|nr:unnamed protein product [Anisakis simplex]
MSSRYLIISIFVFGGLLLNHADVVDDCIKKYSKTFCSRLEKACSLLTHIDIPMHRSIDNYVLPVPIGGCMAQENAQAMCYASMGQENCTGKAARCIFRKLRKRMKNDNPLSYLEMECMRTRGVMQLCAAHHNVHLCTVWKNQCKNALKMALKTSAVKLVVETPNPGLSPELSLCVASQDIMLRCIAKMGQEACSKREEECKRKFGPPDEELPKPLYTLSSLVLSCLASST